MKISQALTVFLNEKSIEGREKSTLQNYTARIRFFIDFTGDIELDELTKDHIKAYQSHLLQKPAVRSFAKSEQPPVSRTTIRNYLTHLKAFFNYLYKEEYMENQIFEKVTIPKAKRKEIEILTPEELEKLWGYFKNTEPGYRYKAFICLILDTGIRRSEAIALSLNDVSIEKAEVHLRTTKSGHERIVDMGHLTRKTLMKYIYKYRYMSTDPNDPLFTMNGGEPLNNDAIKSLFFRLQKYMGRRIYPHLLRHTFATLYLAEYGDIYELKRILGHCDITMVNKYLQMANRLRVKNRSLMDSISKTRKLNGLRSN